MLYVSCKHTGVECLMGSYRSHVTIQMWTVSYDEIVWSWDHTYVFCIMGSYRCGLSHEVIHICFVSWGHTYVDCQGVIHVWTVS